LAPTIAAETTPNSTNSTSRVRSAVDMTAV
jgi:hypothetical protein